MMSKPSHGRTTTSVDRGIGMTMYWLILASFYALTEASCFGIDHNCSQLCLPVSDSFLCQCFHGYKLARDGCTCLDIDECTTYRPCDQICRNTEGSFECDCRHGYKLDVTSGDCLDNNECLDPGSCLINGIQKVCVNLPGGYQCLTEIVAQDEPKLFNTEPDEGEFEKEYENGQVVNRTEAATETKATTKATSLTTSPTTTNSDLPTPIFLCPTDDDNSDDGYHLGSAISSYQLNIIAGCFITAVGLIVVFVIVFIVVKMRQRQRLRQHGLIESPTASTTALTVARPSYQCPRNYGRNPERRSARRWKPYTRAETSHDRKMPATHARTAKECEASKMAQSGKNKDAIKEDMNHNEAVISDFV